MVFFWQKMANSKWSNSNFFVPLHPENEKDDFYYKKYERKL